jgi:hypothetical protein
VTGVVSAVCHSNRIAAARTILPLVSLLILAPSGAGAVKADGLSPKTSATALDRQQALPEWTEGYLYIHRLNGQALAFFP